MNKLFCSLSVLAPALALGFSGPLQAADCERADIDHYLDRGFSPQQVLELCRSGSHVDTVEQAKAQSDQLRYLHDAIDAESISLTQKSLSFKRDLCVKYDRPNYAEQRKQACGTARYVIGLQGMKVLDSSQKLMFWGSNEVLVSSPQVEREFALGQDKLRQRDQDELAKALPQGQEVKIPVREGMSVAAVRARLQQLAKQPSESK